MHKVVVITGASAGIGAALVRRFAEENYRIVLAARRADTLQDLARPLGERARTVPTDVTRRPDVQALVTAALQSFGHIDVWINNAGRGNTKMPLELTDADFDDMMLVNTKSALYGMQMVIPHFIQRGRGHVINVSSYLARVPIATVRAAYCAAKAALNSISASVAQELATAHPNIHVSVVMPGLVATDFARNASPNPASVGSGARPLPPGVSPPQQPEEVAEVIWQLVGTPRPEVFTQTGQPEAARRYAEGLLQPKV